MVASPKRKRKKEEAGTRNASNHISAMERFPCILPRAMTRGKPGGRRHPSFLPLVNPKPTMLWARPHVTTGTMPAARYSTMITTGLLSFLLVPFDRSIPATATATNGAVEGHHWNSSLAARIARSSSGIFSDQSTY